MSFIEMGVISTGISEKKNSSSHAASSLFKFRSSGLPSALSSSIDLVVEGVIGRGVSSVVKLARYEPEIASSSSNDNNDKDEKASPVYYALKIFPLCREVNRTDTNTNHPFHNHNHNDENDNSLQLLLKHSQQQQRSMLIQEIKTLCILRCDCLVHMVGAFYDKGVSVTMVLE